MSRKNNGGTIAIIVTVLLTGGLIYLGVSNQKTNATGSSGASGDNMAGHHGGTSGPLSDLTKLIGQPAPDFQLSGHDGQTYSVSALKGKKVVLFFNEGMMCYPACWNQIAALGSDTRFKADNTVALSIVTDSSTEWQKAMTQMPELNTATVIHDVGGSVSGRYKMLTTASSMHYGQLPGHSYVIIDQQGIIRHVYDDPNMAIHNDALGNEIQKLGSSS